MRKIKVAVIGAGHDHSADAIDTIKGLSEHYELVGYAPVCEDEKNCIEFTYKGRPQRYEGVKQMTVDEVLNYPGLEAVFIETEDRALTKYALLAAEKGLHIQMDKPGGIDNAEFDKLIDIVKTKRLVFHVAYMYRYNTAVMQLKEDIKAGKLGELISVEAQMCCRHSPEKRAWMEAYPGGMLWFLGCHMIDLIYSIMGMPEEVIPLSACSNTDDVTAEDVGMAAFRYKNGVSFARSSAVEYGGFDRRRLLVCGSKGTVEICPLEQGAANAPEIFIPQTSRVREDFAENAPYESGVRNTEPKGRYDAMYRAFAEYIRGEKTNPFDYEYERQLHKLILRACGKEVK